MTTKPLVAIVGRPNVGKSTFFNKIAGHRVAIVEDTPGVTRDRIYADVEWTGREFTLIDTGGIDPRSDDVLLSQMRRQADDLIPSGHGVDGAVDPYIVRMGIGHRRLQLVRVKVSGEGPHTEVRTCQIYSVRAVEHGHFQPFHIPCRSQQLRQLSLFIHHRSCSPQRHCAQTVFWRSDASRRCPMRSNNNPCHWDP